MEAHLVADAFGDVVEIGAVPLRDDHVGQPCGVRGERLLLQAADRKHPALQGHLAGHADGVLHGPARKQRRECGRHRDPGAGAVLRDRAGGHVDVEGRVLEVVLVEAELLRV